MLRLWDGCSSHRGWQGGARGPGFKCWLCPTSCVTLVQLPWPSGLRFPIYWVEMAMMAATQG